MRFLSDSVNLPKESDVRALLGRFGLGGKLAVTPIDVLSGGQRVNKLTMFMADMTCG